MAGERNATALQVAGIKGAGGIHSDIAIIAKSQAMASKELNINIFSKMDPATQEKFNKRVKEIASAIFKDNGITPGTEVGQAFGGFGMEGQVGQQIGATD